MHSVTGVITPAACITNLAGGGVVDHGKISVKDLNPNSVTILPKYTLHLTVNCDAETRYALSPMDNREPDAERGQLLSPSIARALK
nr:DUF1120 domain-containing protein [Pseudomonas sp. PD9R]